MGFVISTRFKFNKDSGRAGEALAVYKLTKYGMNPHLVDGTMPYDLWLPHENTILKVQVKSTNVINSQRGTYKFALSKNSSKDAMYNHDQCDMFALACLPLDKVIYRSDLFGRYSLSFQPEDFKALDEEESLQEALRQVMERKKNGLV